MSYYLDSVRHKIKLDIAKLLKVPKDSVIVETANEKIGSDLAVPCFRFAGQLGKPPQDIAEQLTEILDVKDAEKISAINGFVNVWLAPELLANGVLKDLDKAAGDYGDNQENKNQIAVTEYTDPNPFKPLHIGHAYSNTVGESLSRIYEASGSEVHRVSYHGDVGLHVAKAIWGVIKQLSAKDWKMSDVPESDRADFLGKAYAHGTAAYEDSEASKKEIDALNKEIYERSNDELNALYDEGRKWSFDSFDQMYDMLGVSFEKSYLESETVDIAKKVVNEGLEKGIFEKSDDAVVFRGEQYDLHTRVFINSKGIPTYEAKDLGLAHLKHGDYQYTISIILTGNEQDQYFEVVLKALELLRPELAAATVHLSHGMVRLPEGKMSSRTGDVIKADNLYDDVVAALKKQAPDSPSIKENALGAIKYAFLKQNVGGDIVFDVDQSISLEGNSGPYVQYAAVRVGSILDKTDENGVAHGNYNYEAEKDLLFLLARYPDAVEEALNDHAPHVIATFAFKLAKTWNRYYENVQILGEEDEHIRSARLGVLNHLKEVFEHSLGLLGIEVPEKM